MTSALRAVLFVPGDRPDRIAKACASHADAVAVDLEDAVTEQAKERARISAVAAIGSAPPRAGLLLRVNPSDGPWFTADVAAAAEVLPRLVGVLLPKAEDPDEVRRLGDLLAAAERSAGLPVGRTAVLPIVETPRGVLAAPAVAAASDRVATLLFGTLDLAACLGVTPTVEGRELLHARSQVVLATAAAGLPGPIDGPHAALDDVDGLVRSSAAARDLGFRGRVVLHPRQIEPVQAAFSPSEAELDRARAILAAREAAGDAGAFRLADGTFVDRPVLLRAAALLGESLS
ncbi:HpcH/HpaI aldolase/citrate lyase family protein [Pseudonocardia nigra]|uniref:HpcH/HpaI aldolase/citrate lyase family protein n=1 Tax=Pseudonocardia nigra TaxID=1921578 RepID=UPI001C5E0AAC|nr:CoA ester lyase [Pseudonocardia nigra]